MPGRLPVASPSVACLYSEYNCKSILLAGFSSNVLLFSTALQADDSNTKLLATIRGQFKDLKSTTLDNGLQVHLLPVKGSPVVTTMVAYKVGSCDEEKDQTGLSHYLEHLLFKGTEKLKPAEPLPWGESNKKVAPPEAAQ